MEWPITPNITESQLLDTDRYSLKSLTCLVVVLLVVLLVVGAVGVVGWGGHGHEDISG